jgi:hypothetical protein
MFMLNAYSKKVFMLKKYFYLVLLLNSSYLLPDLYACEKGSNTLSYFNTSVSDTDSLKSPPKTGWEPCTSVFVEFLGKGFISLNIDFRIKETYAISIGYHPLLIPDVMFYHFSGKQRRFEIGGGLSGGFDKDFQLFGAIIHGSVGYRYQKKKGLFFRVGFTPFFVIWFNERSNNNFYPSAGISLGYSF